MRDVHPQPAILHVAPSRVISAPPAILRSIEFSTAEQFCGVVAIFSRQDRHLALAKPNDLVRWLLCGRCSRAQRSWRNGRSQRVELRHIRRRERRMRCWRKTRAAVACDGAVLLEVATRLAPRLPAVLAIRARVDAWHWRARSSQRRRVGGRCQRVVDTCRIKNCVHLE